ncbi:MAG TPA: cysteine methyltransferase [Porticoccaceae bacterium]|nr:cysteine methyltransferase [Porticoccaceae bacterium]
MLRPTPEITDFFSALPSPIGPLTLLASTKGLTEIRFANHSQARATTRDKRNEYIDTAIKQLKEYFAGNRQVFDLTLDEGGTDFQRSVWAQLRAIPFGETVSYGAVAKAIGKPKAARAVGMANNRNPMPIITPCHRVIGSDGSLTGFGGGLDVKRWLLDHERATD